MNTKNIDRTDKLTVNELASKPVQRELSDEELAGVSGGLVVIAIIAILIGQLLPAVQKGDDTYQSRSVR